MHSDPAVARSLDALLASPGFIADPYPVYARLRREAPVHWSDHWGVWVVSRHEDVVAILRDPVRFSSSGRFNALLELLPPDEAALLGPIARFGRGAFNIDPPAHTGLRRILRDTFGPPVIASLRPRVEALVAELLDRAEARGTLDVVRDLALPLPVAVVCELLGAADDERDGFEAWAEAVLAFLALGSVDAERARRAAAAFVAMADRFAHLLASRSRVPRDDLLSHIAAAADAGSIAADDAPLIAAELMIAGHHTTKDLIANAVVALDREPGARAAVTAEPDLWPSAVEEVLRYESSIQRGWRRATGDVEVRGHRLRAGDLVFLMLGAANRDPAAFPDPDGFDPRRTANRHLAFGYGIHLCIGAPLARLEAPIALAELYRRHPDLTLVDAEVDWYPSIHIRGPRTLPVTWPGRTGGMSAMTPTKSGHGQPPTIRRAVPADAPDLAALARRTFEETFAEGNDPDDLAAYLDASFTVAVQHAEITDSGVITLVVEADSSLLGYAQVRWLDPPAEVTGPAPIQLRRFYLTKSSQGLGLGRRLLEAALASARELGGETLWLTVWERNERAIAFYERFGFRVVGTTTFVVGSDVQTDLLMSIALA